MRILFLSLALMPMWAQVTQPVTVQVTEINNITSSATVIDNRSVFTAKNTIHTFCSAGSGSWSSTIQYSDTASTGPWTNFSDNSATVSNASTLSTCGSSTGAIGGGTGYHAFLRFNITGTVSVSYTGQKTLWMPFPLPVGISTTFGSIGSGVNTTAAMVVGSGASLTASGSGFINATSLAFSGLGSGTNTTAAMLVGSGGSLSVSGTGTINANLINGVVLSGLSTGLAKLTSGVPSIAIPGTDYQLPLTGACSQITNTPFYCSADYNFIPQAPGGTLTASTPATVTLTPVPQGVNGSDVGHYVYISGGTGTAEAVLITGGTATSGSSSGTITFTPTNSHSGAWAVSSSSSGIQEAAIKASTTYGRVVVPSGPQHVKATITLPPAVALRCAGSSNTQILQDFTSGDLIYQLSNVAQYRNSSDISDCSFAPNSGVTITSGWLTHIVTGDGSLDNLGYSFCSSCILLDNFIRGTVTNTNFNQWSGTMIQVGGVTGPSNPTISNIQASGSGANIIGINCYSGGYQLANFDIQGGGSGSKGLSFTPSTSNFCGNINVSNGIIDSFLTSVFTAGGGSNGSVEKITIDNIYADGPSAAQAFNINGTQNFQLANSLIQGYGGPVYVFEANSSQNITLTGNTFNDPNATANMVTCYSCTQLTITGNQLGYVSSTGLPDSNTAVAIDISNATEYVEISGNSLGGTIPLQTSGLSPFPSHLVVFSNTGIDDNIPTIGSASSFAMPTFPIFKISGTVNITTATGLWPGQHGTLITTSPLTFSAGATISTTCTTAAGGAYPYNSDGTLLYVSCGGSGGGGSGTVTSITIATTAGQIQSAGTCTITTIGTCTLSLPSSLVLPGTINGLTLTNSTGTITISNGKTVSVSNTLAFTGIDNTTITFPNPSSVTSGDCAAINKSGTTLSIIDAGVGPCGTGSGGLGVCASVSPVSGTTYNPSFTTCQQITMAAGVTINLPTVTAAGPYVLYLINVAPTANPVTFGGTTFNGATQPTNVAANSVTKYAFTYNGIGPTPGFDAIVTSYSCPPLSAGQVYTVGSTGCTVALSLTTSGSGAATLTGGVLNIPTVSSATVAVNGICITSGGCGASGGLALPGSGVSPIYQRFTVQTPWSFNNIWLNDQAGAAVSSVVAIWNDACTAIVATSNVITWGGSAVKYTFASTVTLPAANYVLGLSSNNTGGSASSYGYATGQMVTGSPFSAFTGSNNATWSGSTPTLPTTCGTLSAAGGGNSPPIAIVTQ